MDLTDLPGIRKTLDAHIQRALANKYSDVGKIYGFVAIALALFAIADAIQEHTYRITQSDR